MTLVAGRVTAAGILMVWGAVLCYFYFSGRVGSYLHPSFHGPMVATGVVLVLLAFALLVFGDDPEAQESEGAHTALKLTPLFAVGAVVLVFPLLIAAAVSPSQFGAVAVMNRGFVQSVVDFPGFQTSFTEPGLPRADGSLAEGEAADYGAYIPRNEDGVITADVMDLLYAAEIPEIRQGLEGQEVEVVGQFLPARFNNPGGDRFNLIRMMMVCCAADARPMAVAVRAPQAEKFRDMTWLKVKGRALFPIEGGRPTAILDATEVSETEAPAETLLY